MAMGPERSKPLHNFSFSSLRWGSQRFLRCVKAPTEPSSLDRRSSRFHPKFDESLKNQIQPSRAPKTPNPPYPFHNPKRKFNNNIAEVREKLMNDLSAAAKKLKVSIFEDGAEVAANAKPWNLRTRRAACKAPPPSHEEERKFDLGSSPSPPVKVGEAVVAQENTINERAKFSVSLSKHEVEADFWALVGTKPPRRPKKRPRNVQRQLDTLFPGLWLTEVTPESYKVPDVPE